ncbi:hypothetical protein LCGC14_0535910 [marine sediment metagenome]|uniref:Uncharacterized protein n=1 Tax=marine sediment metagenome TaxID=412755 RepID=A0A0F9SCN0_9ZZZZ|nr:hypothetical protein [Phycisphaerae bacterium]HDZ43041.1 hypothetical protein [Phycisphaerae bacterium]
MNDSVTPPPTQGPPRAPGKASGAKLGMIIIASIIGGFAVVSFLPTILRLRGHHGGHISTMCQANLMGIGKAVALYMAENNDLSPIIKSNETVGGGANGPPTQANGTDDDYDTGQWETALGDQAMQNVWLLIKEELAMTRTFRCPADRNWEERATSSRYGWTSAYEYSYGMHWPYVLDAQGNPNPAPFSDALDGSMVIFADRSPGEPIGPNRRPSNHPKEGTGYLLFSGAYQWQDADDSACGIRGDEIYANAAGVAGGRPQSKTDTSISLSGR